MAILCGVMVVRDVDSDKKKSDPATYSASLEKGATSIGLSNIDTVPQDAARDDIEVYSVSTSNEKYSTSLGTLPERVDRAKMDSWLQGLGTVKRKV